MDEFRTALTVLRENWPRAFPEKTHLIRPLTGKIAPQISEHTGWSTNYVHGVLAVWKRRESYCRAILCHEFRFDLEGIISDETVSDDARQQASKQLEIILAAKTRRQFLQKVS